MLGNILCVFVCMWVHAQAWLYMCVCVCVCVCGWVCVFVHAYTRIFDCIDCICIYACVCVLNWLVDKCVSLCVGPVDLSCHGDGNQVGPINGLSESLLNNTDFSWGSPHIIMLLLKNSNCYHSNNDGRNNESLVSTLWKVNVFACLQIFFLSV